MLAQGTAKICRPGYEAAVKGTVREAKIGQNWVLFIGLRWIPSRTEYPRVQSLPPAMVNFLSISIRVLAARM